MSPVEKRRVITRFMSLHALRGEWGFNAELNFTGCGVEGAAPRKATRLA
jgi:hypothetical protein